MYLDVPLVNCLNGFPSLRTARYDGEKLIRRTRLLLFVALAVILTSSCTKRAVVKPSTGLESEVATAGTIEAESDLEPTLKSDPATVAIPEPDPATVAIPEPELDPATVAIPEPDPAAIASPEPETDSEITANTEPKATTEPSSSSLPGFKRPAEINLDRQAMANSSGGELLWSDRSLGTSGRTCDTCHRNDNLFGQTFSSPYPHRVALVDKSNDVGMVEIDEMVNFCIANSLGGELLPWNSNELLMLSAYVLKRQSEFIENQKLNQYKQ